MLTLKLCDSGMLKGDVCDDVVKKYKILKMNKGFKICVCSDLLSTNTTILVW